MGEPFRRMCQRQQSRRGTQLEMDWLEELKLARDSRSSDILASLAKGGDPAILYVLASNPSTPPDVLACLSKSDLTGIRCAVAKNEQVPLSVLAELAKDNDSTVRAAVAANKNFWKLGKRFKSLGSHR